MTFDFPRIATLLILVIVVVTGGIVTILHPEALSFRSYLQDVAIGAGLLGVGLGIDATSKP